MVKYQTFHFVFIFYLLLCGSVSNISEKSSSCSSSWSLLRQTSLLPTVIYRLHCSSYLTLRHLVDVQFTSVTQLCPTLCDSMNCCTPRPPCPSPSPGDHSDSHPSSQWCHPTILSSVVLFSSCPQSLPASMSFQMSQLFTSGGQSIGVSALASVLPVNTQGWSPLERTGWISLQSRGLSL